MAMAQASQRERNLAIESPLGTDVLLLRRFSGVEELGRLFRFDLDLLSERPDINFDQIVGHNVTVRVQLQTGAQRYFNGFISEFSQLSVGRPGGYSTYRATMVPWLWLLTRTADCRIFQKKTARDIIKQVFAENGFSDIEDTLTAPYRVWDYCVQYRETVFNFVSRLMEQEGIYYYFKHANGKHTIVLCDAPAAHAPFPDYASIPFRPHGELSVATGHIHEWNLSKRVEPGAYAHTDYNFTKPRTPMLHDPLQVPPATIPRGNGYADYEVFDYPGEYPLVPDGEQYGKVRIQELQARYELTEAAADSRGICTGFKFTLKEHPRQDQNRDYVVQWSSFRAATAEYETTERSTQEEEWVCQFRCIPATTLYRAERITPKPLIQGTQTAVCVGPRGEEIYTDEFGRAKLQFHWDRYGKYDQDSSCWIRVAQSWAGKKWGALFLPRLGQEVLVAFIEGDPDQPIIVGSVYNQDQMPHYPLDGTKTKSYIKSNSSMGGAGYNEIRFEDKAGMEQIFTHGQKDLDVRIENDARELILHDRHLIVGHTGKEGKVGDQFEMVYRDKHFKVHRDRVEHVGGNMELLVGGIDGPGKQDITVLDDKKETLAANSHLTVAGTRKEQIGGNQHLTVGGNQEEKIGAKHAVMAGGEIHLQAGMKITLEAGMQITLKTPGGFIDINPGGVFIQGAMVLINSGGAPGAGGGSSPGGPDAAKVAEPIEPLVADDSVTGQKSL